MAIYAKINMNAMKSIQTKINNLLGEYQKKAKELQQLYAEKFCECARTRIINRTAGNESGVDYSKYINVIVKASGSYYVEVTKPSGEPYIMSFLEYGTGLKGKNDPHPNASFINWEYAINEDRYKKYIKDANDVGWIFTDNGNKYVNQKQGDVRFGSKDDKVFSSGIEPVKYIYDTQRQFRTIVNLSFVRGKNGKTMFSLKSLETRLRKARA